MTLRVANLASSAFPATVTDLTVTNNLTLSAGTANGVLYLNGSKVVTSGSALSFDGTRLAVNGGTNGSQFSVKGTSAFVGFDTGTANDGRIEFAYNGTKIFEQEMTSASLMTLKAVSGVSLSFGANNAEQMRLNSTGLGIGTNNPLAKLSLSASGNPRTTNGTSSISLNNTVTTRSAIIGYDDSQNLVLWNSTNASGATQFYTGTGSGTLQMTLDASGNLGLGVTPSAWISTYRAIQIGIGSSINGRTDNTQTTISSNAFRNSAGNWIYLASGENATQYLQNVSGAHAWFTAASGTAGNAITFTQAMTLDSDGDLGIGTTNPQRKLHIVSAAPLRMGQAADYFEFQQSAANLWAWISSSGQLPLYMDGAGGSVIIGPAAIATNATNGFLYVPTCAGTPTGTPTTYTGRSPIVVDSTNNKLYFYSGGQWRDAGP